MSPSPGRNGGSGADRDDGERHRPGPRRRGADAARAVPARRLRAHRHQGRLRHLVVRRMHRSRRRRVGEVVHDVRGASRRACGHDHRGSRTRGSAAPGAAGVPRPPRPAVRVLHRGHGHGRGLVARGDPEPDRARRARRARGQPLPMHGLPQHRAGRARGGGERAVIPASFDYVRAGSADEAVGALAQHGDDAKLLAGGMSLIPLMKLRLATPGVLVDVGRVRDLSYVRDAGDHIAIGALTRHRDVETDDLLARECGVVRAVAAQVGDNQVRHRGTIGGSVAHGDPASDLPAALLALDATFVVKGANGERTIPASEMFQGFLETALAPDELMTEIRVLKTGANGFAFEKFNRRAQDYAIVGAVAATVHGKKQVALVNMGPTPLRATAVENALAQGAAPDVAAREAAVGTEPTSDLNASPEYREHLAQVLVRRALEGM